MKVDEMKKQAGGMLSFHRSDNQDTERERQRVIQGLHKNTSHAYSQDVLSFMLGREGESVHTGNKTKKGNKTTQNGKKSNKHTTGESRV